MSTDGDSARSRRIEISFAGCWGKAGFVSEISALNAVPASAGRAFGAAVFFTAPEAAGCTAVAVCAASEASTGASCFSDTSTVGDAEARPSLRVISCQPGAWSASWPCGEAASLRSARGAVSAGIAGEEATAVALMDEAGATGDSVAFEPGAFTGLALVCGGFCNAG